MSVKSSAPRRRRVVSGLRTLLFAFGAAALGGVILQEIAAQHDRRSLAAPGRLVAIDGSTRLHIRCRGQGAPTIVLEGGATAFVPVWDWIQPPLARAARVCAYDRAGLGWSDRAPGAPDGARAAERLHRLLRAAGERGPFLLVGHSLGGALVRVYADRYPGDVAGLVLIDPAHPDGAEQFPAGLVSHYRWVRRWHALAPVAARLGLLRLVSFHLGPAAGLPPAAQRAARVFGASPRHLLASYREMAVWETIMEQARAARLADKPLLVLSAGRSHVMPEAIPTLLRLHAETARGSRRGVQRVIADATHFSIVTDRALAERTADAIAGFRANLLARGGVARRATSAVSESSARSPGPTPRGAAPPRSR